MAIFTESVCLNLLNESSQDIVSEFLSNIELSSISIQRICEESKKYHLSISESYLLEASSPKPSDLEKIGIKGASSKLNKATDDIVSLIKKNGANSETKKKIHNIVSDLFQQLSDNVDKLVIASNPKLKNIEKSRKTADAFTLLIWFLVIGNLIALVLTKLLGGLGGNLVVLIVAPVMEEACKAIAVKGGFEKEYNLIFNVYEFSMYVSGGQTVKSRLFVVGMHTFTTIINKLFSTEAFRKKFGISDDKDAKDKCTLASYIIGLFIHISWNTAASFCPAFNAALQ